MNAPTPEVSAELLAESLGVSIRTARRFKAAGVMPFAYAVVWAILGEGDLGIADASFVGWRVRDGQLIGPDGYGFTAGELSAIPIRNQQLAALERERREPRQLLLCASN